MTACLHYTSIVVTVLEMWRDEWRGYCKRWLSHEVWAARPALLLWYPRQVRPSNAWVLWIPPWLLSRRRNTVLTGELTLHSRDMSIRRITMHGLLIINYFCVFTVVCTLYWMGVWLVCSYLSFHIRSLISVPDVLYYYLLLYKCSIHSLVSKRKWMHCGFTMKQDCLYAAPCQ